VRDANRDAFWGNSEGVSGFFLGPALPNFCEARVKRLNSGGEQSPQISIWGELEPSSD